MKFFAGFLFFAISIFAQTESFQVKMVIGKAVRIENGVPIPLRIGDFLKNETLILSEKTVIILQRAEQSFRIQGTLSIRLADLEKNLGRLDQFLLESAKSQTASRRFLLNLRPSMAMGVRAEEQRTEPKLRWMDETEESASEAEERIREHYHKGEIEAVLKVFSEEAEKPDSFFRTETLFYVAASFFEILEYEKSVFFFEAFFKRKDLSSTLEPAADFLFAQSLFALERYAQAAQVLEKFLIRYPEAAAQPPVFLLQAKSYLKQNQITPAKTALEKILDQFPQDVLAEDSRDLLKELK